MTSQSSSPCSQEKIKAILRRTHTFLTHLTTQAPLSPTLLSNFAKDIKIHEHGLPTLAPFLGRDYVGLDAAQQYFECMGAHLRYEGMRFEDEAEWVVDGARGVVVVRGWARFLANRTGQGWGEGFVYRLRLDSEDSEGEDGQEGEVKVKEYFVWADTGAAYLALRGELTA
ncbi:hypothetical protein ASPACDRAFT_61212 [Aspergillus aculeatus ATCC 16872]|uniref:SnoaL-like domain-containing protein n=1 Tax=Aspergillus aculeatus (strain ATCC 16872 / CBS 172.66 / WB 5094) TaxID=690307 RepID=A0A1L9WTH4_ASPA1|nr:uncharacterized protein ASPACDRAFT_61212 [Aspergillus aculeatus ATCC 16872]OJJ99438.1 hypothetical protein ASPACDRAFT_61212 [Aspergillus aculeatus ATCC 16872]